MFVIDDIIGELVSQGVGKAQDKLIRNETVLKLLDKFNLKPDEPPNDVEGVYRFTLVEYGIGKPKPILELFRQQEIQEAFSKAFGQNNPSILLREVEDYIKEYAVGDEIREQEIDYEREFAEFSALFIEIAKRARTTTEILQAHQIDKLQDSLATIREQLESLSLEAMQAEIAQLVQSYQDLLPPSQEPRKTDLAQQMRDWFDALRYDFENYEVWAEDYFEWIINIQSELGYDRILVRGIEGEAGINDVAALRQSVDEQDAHGGWLVANLRIAPSARNKAKKERKLFCYTFDELLDKKADFSGYLDSLEAEVKRLGIDQMYVPLACTKEEIDPDTEQKPELSLYDEREGWIDGYIDRWLDDPAKEHISILGEFGTGKTWFAFHYAWTALQSYRDAKKRGVRRPRLPLVIPLRDYAKAVSVESLFSEFFFRRHEIPLPGYSAFEQLNRMGKLLLIFDGFDEMAVRIDRQKLINNFWELTKVVVPGSKVILTCRTGLFEEDSQGRTIFNARGRATLNSDLQVFSERLIEEKPQFEILEIQKLNNEQICQVLEKRTQPANIEKIMGNHYLLDLARRPIMIDFILEALPDIELGNPVDISRIYLYASRRKMERDIKTERTFTSLADKLYFLCELAWEMLANQRMHLNYRGFSDRIRKLFGAIVQEQRDLDHWQRDLMRNTMLIRNEEGDYTFAHRSLLEFFAAYKLAAELGILASDFTEVAQAQSSLDKTVAPIDYTWSTYFQRQIDEEGNFVLIPALNSFVSQNLEELGHSLGKLPLTQFKAVLDLLLPMLDPTEKTLERLLNLIKETQNKTEEEVNYVGGNAATLLIKHNSAALEGKNLTGAVLKSADFTNASLRRTNFTGAILTDSVFPKNLGSVESVAFSSNGGLLATGDADNMVRLWVVLSGKEHLSCKGHTAPVISVAFSPDDEIIASGSDDKMVKLWDTQTGECLRTLEGHTHPVTSVVFNSDGQRLISGSDDQKVRLWDTQTGECIMTLEGHTNTVTSVAFSPDNQRVASGSHDQTAKLWNPETGDCLHTLKGHTNLVRSVAFSPDKKTIATGSYDQTIKLWNIETGQCYKTFKGHPSTVTSVVFSSDGETIASGSYDQTVKLWNIETGECLQTFYGHTNPVRAVVFNPNGSNLASGSDDQTVRFWDIETGDCHNIFQGYANQVTSVAFSPDGNTLVSGNYDHTLKLWDAHTGECLKTFEGHTNPVRSVAFSPDGNSVLSGSYDHTLKLWDAHTGECLQTFEGHTNQVIAIAFDRDGRNIISGSYDHTLKLWDAYTGKCVKTFEGHTNPVRSVAFSPDGNSVLSGSYDKTVKLWDIHTGKCLRTFYGHTKQVTSVAFSCHEDILASGSYDKTIKLWDVQTGECLKTFKGHTNPVRSVAFSPDGKKLASGSYDKTVRLWDTETGECFIGNEHTNRVMSVAFSPNGENLASSSSDGTIKLWNINCATIECQKTMRDRPCEGMNITAVIGLTDIQKNMLIALGANYNCFSITESVF